MRILFVKLSSIGDVVHTLPALSAVKKAFPDAEVSWVVETRSAEILRNNPLVSRLIEVDTKALRRKDVLGKTLKTAKKQLRELRASEFDLAIDFQGLFKSASITKLARTKQRFGFSKRNLRELASRVLMNNEIDVDPHQNIILKNIKLAEGSIRAFIDSDKFALEKEEFDYPISTTQVHKDEASEIIERAGETYAILNPAGGWVTKLWPAENYGILADKLWSTLGITSIISTAPDEIDLAEEVVAASLSARTIVAQPSLKGFYELAKRAMIYVGGDTAPTHLAVAANCPVVGIFGPTEWWRNGSIIKDDLCVERNDIDCRVECHRRTCDNWICMDISVETVLEAVTNRIGSFERIEK